MHGLSDGFSWKSLGTKRVFIYALNMAFALVFIASVAISLVANELSP